MPNICTKGCTLKQRTAFAGLLFPVGSSTGTPEISTTSRTHELYLTLHGKRTIPVVGVSRVEPPARGPDCRHRSTVSDDKATTGVVGGIEMYWVREGYIRRYMPKEFSCSVQDHSYCGTEPQLDISHSTRICFHLPKLNDITSSPTSTDQNTVRQRVIVKVDINLLAKFIHGEKTGFQQLSRRITN